MSIGAEEGRVRIWIGSRAELQSLGLSSGCVRVRVVRVHVVRVRVRGFRKWFGVGSQNNIYT